MSQILVELGARQLKSGVPEFRVGDTVRRPLRPTTSPTKRMRMLSGPAAVDRFALGDPMLEPMRQDGAYAIERRALVVRVCLGHL